MPLTSRSSGRRARAMAAVVFCGTLALAAGGCGIFGGGKSSSGGGKGLSLLLSASAKLNTCGNGPANALGVRIYQLGGDRGIAGAPQSALWEDDGKELGTEQLDKVELFLDPESKQTVALTLKPGARFVAVVGNFCSSKGTCWRWIAPVEGMKSETALRFGEMCVEEAK